MQLELEVNLLDRNVMNCKMKGERFRWNTPQYTYGDNQFGIQFPVITFCDKLPEYKNILGEDCGQKVCIHKDWIGDGFCDDLTNTPGCNYDGGDCCLGTIHLLHIITWSRREGGQNMTTFKNGCTISLYVWI